MRTPHSKPGTTTPSARSPTATRWSSTRRPTQQQRFPTYYREDIETITVDPPPHTIEVEHITTVQVPDYEVQYITVDRTLLAFDGLAVIADFTPGLDHLLIAGPEVPAGVAYSITARDVNGALTLAYEGTDIAVLLGHTTQEYSTSWWA